MKNPFKNIQSDIYEEWGIDYWFGSSEDDVTGEDYGGGDGISWMCGWCGERGIDMADEVKAVDDIEAHVVTCPKRDRKGDPTDVNPSDRRHLALM